MMMSNKLVASLKANGKILREVKDTIYVPFGQEYSIFLKNLNSARALIHIQIDGQEVCDSGFVLDANKECDLERFIKNGNLKSGNRFKFIERTASVEQHRGVKSEDGIIRISFQYEKPVPLWTTWHNEGYCPSPRPWPTYTKETWGGPVYGVGQLQGNNFGDKWLKSAGGTGEYIAPTSIGTCSATGASGASDAVVSNSLRGVAASVNQVDASYTAPINEAGITVPGSVSNQTFGTTTMRALEAEEHVIVLRILGETDAGIKVMAPVTVKAKPKCVTCGRTNKATNKFCSQCGTSLEIV